MSPVSRRARLIDLASLGCIVVGAALWVLATSQLSEISKLSRANPSGRTGSALAAADRARYLAYGGAALIAAGCVVGVTGAIQLARRKPAS